MARCHAISCFPRRGTAAPHKWLTLVSWHEKNEGGLGGASLSGTNGQLGGALGASLWRQSKAQKLGLPHILLLLLPGKIQAKNPESGRRNNGDATVNILICLLFVLLLLLFLAWHYLNRVTEGRYHPRHLMRNLVLWWQQFQPETLSEDLAEDYQDEQQSDGELEEEQQQHVEDGGGGEEEEEEEEEKEEEEGKQQQLLQEEEEKLTKEANQEAAVEEALEEDEASKAAQGSAEVLLIHLHSFAGTASWEDTGKSLNVTAL